MDQIIQYAEAVTAAQHEVCGFIILIIFDHFCNMNSEPNNSLIKMNFKHAHRLV